MDVIFFALFMALFAGIFAFLGYLGYKKTMMLKVQGVCMMYSPTGRRQSGPFLLMKAQNVFLASSPAIPLMDVIKWPNLGYSLLSNLTQYAHKSTALVNVYG